MYRVNAKGVQWLIDFLYGAMFVGPVIAYAILASMGYDFRWLVYIAIGSGMGYMLYVSQKVVIFEQMVQESVKEEAKSQVPERAKEEVEERAKEEVEERAKEEVEEKVEEADLD